MRPMNLAPDPPHEASKFGYLWRLNRLLQIASERFESCVKIQNLTIRQVYVLSAIGDEGLSTQREVCRVTGIDRSTMSEVLRRLERRGLVTSRRDTKDRRATILQLTEQGCAARVLGEQAVSLTERALMEIVNKPNRQQFLKDLDAFLLELVDLYAVPRTKKSYPGRGSRHSGL